MNFLLPIPCNPVYERGITEPRVPSVALSTEEEQQILQTIEMFEAIAGADPDDYQSLSLLKEAYQKLDRTEEMIQAARRLGEAYARTGQTGAAIREFEQILQRHPEHQGLSGTLDTLIQRLREAGRHKPQNSGPTDEESRALEAFEASLMATEQTRKTMRHDKRVVLGEDDGNEQLGRFFINNNLAPADRVKAALEAVRVVNSMSTGGSIGTSLLDEVCRNRPEVELTTLVGALLDRTRFAYVPLEYYEVDRSVVKLLPDELTLGRLIVPFDQISRTLLVALCNPFDAAGKEAVQQVLDYDIQWFFAMPGSITRVLSEAYRLSVID